MHICSEAMFTRPSRRSSVIARPQPQVELPLATECVLRYVGQSRLGNMLIEVVDGHTCVNGKLVPLAFPEQARQVRLP